MQTSAAHGHRSAAGSRAGERGFSFIEILVVMGIIGVLVGMVTVAIQIWGKKGPEFLTKQRLTKVAAGIREVKRTFEEYPPLDMKTIPRLFMLEGLKIKPDKNGTNMGIESVVQCLYLKGLKYDAQLSDGEFVNTDEDELKVAFTKRSALEMHEVRDEWDQPMIYIPARSYGLVDGDAATYINADGMEVEARPWKSENGGFQNPQSFQLFSMGADGEPNTEDDVLAWSD